MGNVSRRPPFVLPDSPPILPSTPTPLGDRFNGATVKMSVIARILLPSPLRWLCRDVATGAFFPPPIHTRLFNRTLTKPMSADFSRKH